MYLCEADGRWLKSCSGGSSSYEMGGYTYSDWQKPCVDIIYQGDQNPKQTSFKFNNSNYRPYGSVITRDTRPPYPIADYDQYYKLHYLMDGDDQTCQLVQTHNDVYGS